MSDHPRNTLRDLEQMITRLLEAARKLPPGEERCTTLKEIGRFRVRLDAAAPRPSK